MTEAIICAIITGGVTLIGIIINGRIISRKRQEEEALKHNDIMHEIANIKDDIQFLQKRVDEHNQWGNKFAEYTKEVAVALAEIRKDITFLRNGQ